VKIFSLLDLDSWKTGPTRLELATSAVTGRCSNQLNYDPLGLLIDHYLHYLLYTNSTLYDTIIFLYVNFLFQISLETKEKQGFEPWVQVIVR
jgi:hypothetical protein